MKVTKEIEKILNGEAIIDSLNNNIFLNPVSIDKSVFGTPVGEKGSVFFTSTRLIIYVKKWPIEDLSKQININSIINITHKKRLLDSKIIFYTNDSEIKIKISDKGKAKRFFKSFETHMLTNKTKIQKILNSIKFQIDVPNPLKLDIENPIKITINNKNEIPIYNIQVQSDISTLVKCDKPTVQIKTILPNSSEYTAIFIIPKIADKINLGDLYISYDIDNCTYEKEPIAIGIYEALEVTSHKSTKYSGDINSDISISRETEFYQGYIRLKMSVTNTSLFVVNDVSLDFDYDHNLLRIDRREPDYQIKNGRTIFGNISANSSKTIAVYFDPMMCSKGADINCQVNYKDAKGQPQTTHMKPKQISVVCPIMETESDINIGRLKEFIEKLPYRDSKVYQVQNGFDINVLKNISREIVQKHHVKHIRTLLTKDRDTCEIWYYGKTKVHGHDIVIKITILSETQNVELFATTQTKESLVGLLAEFGRELKNSIQNNIAGNVQQVINLSIIDSIVQRSNLLSYCDINGNCSGDVVIDGSYIQHSNIGHNGKQNEEGFTKMEYSKVYEYLINIAGKGCDAQNVELDLYDSKERKKLQNKKILITYGDVLKQFGEKPNDRKAQNELFKILDKINEYTKPILLSALVVNQNNILPSNPFFPKWLPLTKDEDKLRDWVKELEKIWQYYCK